MPSAQRNSGNSLLPSTSWKWKGRWSTKGLKAAVAGAEIERIASKSGTAVEHITASVIVQEASSPRSPIHSCFEWSDGVAAQKHREHQARTLLGNLVRVELIPAPLKLPIKANVKLFGPEMPKESIGFVRVNLPDIGSCYVQTSSAMRDNDLRQQVLAEAMAYLKGAQRRFSHLEELKDVFEAIDRADAKLS